ncbi:MAG: dTDP-glucose 4,6-dehydratase [Myxococcaceae bacterium]|nr:dTDP-glucose 4,6-dehydratase [Myxococcaceae bacterium]
MNVLITGGCGFIGSNLVKYVRRERPGWKIVTLDKLTYAGNLENLKELEDDEQHVFIQGDINDKAKVTPLFQDYGIDAVLHLAAESHVDRSILGPEAFTVTNVLGTQVLLDAARAAKVKRFVMVSTDEVYGSLGPTGAFTEESPLKPSSPYSASKTGADLLALAYAHTFGMDVVVTRCSNNYGRYQFPEKLIPLMVLNALADKQLPVYGDGKNVRDWLHVEDHCSAIIAALEKGKSGEVYNIGGGAERQNIEIVKLVLGYVGKPESLIKYVQDRPGHDKRYAIDPSKTKRELGWSAKHSFETGLKDTVQWYLDNRAWWERVTSGAYREYYASQYQKRLAG